MYRNGCGWLCWSMPTLGNPASSIFHCCSICDRSIHTLNGKQGPLRLRTSTSTFPTFCVSNGNYIGLRAWRREFDPRIAHVFFMIFVQFWRDSILLAEMILILYKKKYFGQVYLYHVFPWSRHHRQQTTREQWRPRAKSNWLWRLTRLKSPSTAGSNIMRARQNARDGLLWISFNSSFLDPVICRAGGLCCCVVHGCCQRYNPSCAAAAVVPECGLAFNTLLNFL